MSVCTNLLTAQYNGRKCFGGNATIPPKSNRPRKDTTMSKTYDAFALDKPQISLGDIGEFTLGDITESRRKRIVALAQQAEDLQESENVLAHVRALACMVEAACENADGLGEKIEKLYADEVIGQKSLAGLARFVQEWLVEEVTAGEG